jgi:hypothetical protein
MKTPVLSNHSADNQARADSSCESCHCSTSSQAMPGAGCCLVTVHAGPLVKSSSSNSERH